MRLRRGPVLCVSALAIFGAGCTASVPVEPGRGTERPASLEPSPPQFLDERALLLLLADRQLFEEAALEPLLGREEELRERLAETLGRIGDRRARRMLEALLGDRVPAVRRAAAFGLGELEDEPARAALMAAAADGDRETGLLAVEALGKLGAPIEEVRTALAALPAVERDTRLLPSLFRFKEDAAVRIGAEGLAQADPRLRAWAAYGLARDARPGAAPLLRPLTADSDPWVRGWAARALGAVGDGNDLALLRPLLEDRAPGPVIQALRAAQRLIDSGKAPAPGPWRARLLELCADPRPAVSVTALEAASSWLLDDQLSDALVERARRPWSVERAGRLERESEVSLLSLAQGKDPNAPDLVAAWARSPERGRRLRAAEAAGALSDRRALTVLAADPWPAVRAAVLTARLAASAPAAEARAAATAALGDPAVAVRSTAFDWFAEHPVLPLDALVLALQSSPREGPPDARIAAVRAIVSRGKAERLEQGAAVERLEQLAEDAEFLVRREAANALASLGRPAPPLGGSAPVWPLEHYRALIETTAGPRDVDLRTRHGLVRLRLDCPRAPLTCASFMQLAAQGFFDGLAFHRVVPDFVVQGGDPEGDGSGGPGYSLRDEINRLRYVRGAVGMALSGPDTGGSQFFVTLSSQPHLDGGYTVFGTVVEGMEVLDQIAQGDRIERVVVR